jgi:Uma2 family endonuclease
MATANLKTVEKPLKTDKDYFALPQGTRLELIDGRWVAMSPAPLIEHQREVLSISATLFSLLRKRLRDHGGSDNDASICQVLPAPVDVRLSDLHVFQPDIVVLCDPSKIVQGKYIAGAPDMVVEILSPSNAKYDKGRKKELYALYKVPRYLIVDSANQLMEYYDSVSDGKYGEPVLLSGGDCLDMRWLLGEAEGCLDIIEMLDWSIPDAPEERVI